jgi:UDP-glucose 4-epimerase
MFASSREVYGNTREPVHAEDDVHVSMCESPYTASKLGGEALVHAYAQCYGIDFIIMRFSNVYGMYDDSDRVIPLFIRSTKAGRDLVIYGKDKMLDFTYIDDAVDGVVKCIGKFDAAKNDVYNLAFGEGVAITRVAELIRSRTGSKSRIKTGEKRTGEVVRFVADITKARKKLN